MGGNASLKDFDPENQNFVLCPSDIRYTYVPYRFSDENSVKTMNLTGNQIRKLPKGLHALKILTLDTNDIEYIPHQMEKSLLSYRVLECLDLSNNHIRAIPSSFGKLPSLKELILANNVCMCFECSILPRTLETLNLAQNRLAELPSAYPESLRVLIVPYNLLETLEIRAPYLNCVYASMNKISSLQLATERLLSLDVSRNKLPRLPNLAEGAPSLVSLDASTNAIVELPILPTSMKRIVLASNRIDTIASLSQFEELAELDISDNDVRNLPELPGSLTSLHAHRNRLVSVADSECKKITQFLMMRNELKEIPAICRNVTDVFLMDNQISAIRLENLCQHVMVLRLSENELSAIPPAVFALPRLENLSLFRNRIVTIPPEITQSKLIVFNISENPIEEITCEMPLTLAKFVCSYCRLKSLDCLQGHKGLTDLCAYGNELSSLPELPALARAHLGHNRFEQFPGFPSLVRVIDLSCNMIASIGSELRYDKLQDLDLSWNRLSSFPDVFGCREIQSLKVSHNPLTYSFDFSLMPQIVNIDIAATFCETRGDFPGSLKEVMTSDAGACDSVRYKHVEECSWASFCELRGMRPTMEDAVVFQPLFTDEMSIFAVCDGHGGSSTAHFCARAICTTFRQLEEFTEPAVSACIENIVEQVKQQTFRDGTTLSMVLLSRTSRAFMSINIGDSRTLLLTDAGDVRFATRDHKPNDPDELERIVSAHGKVIGQRVDGQLAVARTIGDFHVHGVSHEPSIARVAVLPSDKWLVIGCDGVYDVFSNKEIGVIGAELDDPVAFAYRIRNSAYSRVSPDNISTIAINLKTMIC